MKKILIIFILILNSLIIIKYFTSNYTLEYKVNNHSIKSTYKDGRFYYEIDNKYNFDVYEKRKLKKTFITKINEIEAGDYECIYPIIENTKTYPLCIKDGTQIDYNLIDNEEVNKYKSTPYTSDKTKSNFIYNNNLGKNTYIALWNYKGYTIMNDNNYENVELLKKDRYDNSLSYMIDNIVYMPDYNKEHEFTRLIALDIITKSIKYIDLNYKIDYDAYVVGSIKNNLYIFDNKHSVLYEINVKNKNMSIKSSNEIGYVKYENGEFTSCSKSEYKVNKIKYNLNSSIYEYKFDNVLYKRVLDNKNINTIIINEDVSIIHEYKNNLFYVYKDALYMYSPIETKEIFYSFELNFNKDNTIFIYNK